MIQIGRKIKTEKKTFLFYTIQFNLKQLAVHIEWRSIDIVIVVCS